MSTVIPDLLAARSQMAVSLAFHIVFAVIGIGMPVLMVVAERRWQTTGDAAYLELARRWAKGTAILFAAGAVSGTILWFELGLTLKLVLLALFVGALVLIPSLYYLFRIFKGRPT
ncbi:MAG TPA: cytochrome ubiquinol oxidase subunit I [Gemmatimonadales bacterium]|nr:cytochrome ubiquinol oxidase subunit I [Gemmatimonadales bacterium]